MDPNLKQAYDAYNTEIGRLFGQSFNVYRPPLGTTQNQTPTLTLSGASYKVEKSGPILAQPAIYNMEYYAVFGDFSQLVPGDVLVPTDSTSSTPTVTFLSKSPGEGAKAFRTNRTCKLINNISPETGLEDVVYSNVRFDFLPTGFSRGQFDELVQGAGKSLVSAVLYSLPNLQMNNVPQDIVGMRLVQTDGAYPVYWTIKLAEEIEPLMHLSLEQDGR